MLKSTLKALLFTFVIILLSGLIASLTVGKAPNSLLLIQNLLLIIFSLAIIKWMKIDFHLKLPQLKTGVKIFFISFFLSIVVFAGARFLISLITGVPFVKEIHPVLQTMAPWEFFLYVFILASIAEELIFRGFLLNALKPVKQIFFGKINLAILISALIFASAHLGLLKMGSSPEFVAAIFIYTFTIGYLAGYYQEKYNNTAYAILTHMGANLTGLIVIILMNVAGIQL